MQKKTKEKISCIVLTAGGVALCIAGIWFPPLLVLGGAMIAGGLTILSNYLQDKDRFTVNNNYGNVERSPSMRMKIIRATPKQKQAALFAFKNRKYAMHHEPSFHPEEPKVELQAGNEPIPLPEDIRQELDKINEMFNTIDIELISRMAAQYNLAQRGERNSIDNENHPKA